MILGLLLSGSSFLVQDDDALLDRLVNQFHFIAQVRSQLVEVLKSRLLLWVQNDLEVGRERFWVSWHAYSPRICKPMPNLQGRGSNDGSATTPAIKGDGA